MNEEEKKAVCELKNYITKRNRSYTKLDRHDKAINNLLNLIDNLQKENTEFEKLSKNYSYSVDIVRENTRLRRQVFDLELENEEFKKTVERQNLEIMAQKDAHDFDTEIANETINKQKELIEYLRRSCDRKESCWIEEQHENVELETKLEEKEKIINAMVEYIANLDIDEDICKKMGIFQDCEIKDVENCKKCIIEYFKNKMRQKCDTATTEK